MSLERVLRVIPPEGEGITVAAIADAAGVKRRNVSQLCDRLRKRGLVDRLETDRYLLTGEGVTARDAGTRLTSGPNGPHAGPRCLRRKTFRDRVWNAFRQLQRATVSDLVTFAAMPDEVDTAEAEHRATNNARKYVELLVRSGHVNKLRPREPGTRLTSNGFAIFLLVKNTGPLAPRSTTKGGAAILDPNTDERFPLAEVVE